MDGAAQQIRERLTALLAEWDVAAQREALQHAATQAEELQRSETEVLRRLDDLLAEVEAASGEQHVQADALANQRGELAEQQQALAEQTAALTQQRQAIEEDQHSLEQRQQSLDQQQQELAAREAALNATQQSLEEAVLAQQAAEASLHAEREQHASEHTEQLAELQELAEYLQTQQDTLSEQQQALEARQSHLAEVEAALDQRLGVVDRIEQVATTSVEDLAERELALSRREQELAAQATRVETELARASEHESELAAARKRLAEQLRTQRQRQQKVLAEREAELDARADALAEEATQLASQQHASDGQDDQAQQQLAEQLAAVERERDTAIATRDELADRLAAEQQTVESLEQQIQAVPDPAELQQKFDLAMEEARSLKEANARLKDELAERPAAGEDLSALADAQAEVESLRQQLADAQQGEPDDLQDELQRRFELAVEDLRELKQENADLLQQVELLSAQQPSVGPADGDSFDWEAQKRALLAELGDEGEPLDDERREARVTIEGTIRITDEVIAAKERELADMRQLLEQQSGSIGEVAVGAGAIAELFDQDEAITAERERLSLLQSEWEEKLREAELEISLNRAKCARERMELETQQRELAQLKEELEHLQPAGDGESRGKPRRKWLERLGLKGEEE